MANYVKQPLALEFKSKNEKYISKSKSSDISLVCQRLVTRLLREREFYVFPALTLCWAQSADSKKASLARWSI